MENTKINQGGVYKNGCISPFEEKEQLTFIDFFAGIGGFRRGLELAGWQCVGFCEFDKYATASYTAMHLITEEQKKHLETLSVRRRQKEILKEEYRNGEWYISDIRDANAGNLPKADCWCFGAPCQDFSVAGKRAGLDGDRSSLVREIFRLLEEQEGQDRPEWLIYENVKGMFSSNRGLDYLSILSEMDRLGYDIEWQNINSKWFVPQNRERIYTIGHLRRFGRRKVLPVTGTDGENSVSIIAHRNGYRRNMQTFSPDGITEALDTGQGGGSGHHVGIKLLGNVNPCGHGMNGNVYDSQAAAPALTTNKGEGSKVAIPVLTPDRVNKRQNGRRFKEDGEPMFTLTAQDRHGVAMSISGHTVKDSENISHCLNANDQRKVFGAKQERTLVGVPITAQDGHGVSVEVGRIIDGMQKHQSIKDDGIYTCLTSSMGQGGGYVPMIELKLKEATQILDTSYDKGIYVEMPEGLVVYAVWYEKYQCYITIRKLTPKECFRLQGWSDEYFERAALVNSDSQLYKQAGNGVTVDVVNAIGKQIYLSE